MTADWLYPLSSKAEYRFVYEGGFTKNTGPASFEAMMNRGATDDTWGAYKNWRRAKRGDRVWVYYGTADGDLGVVGLATIKAINAPVQSGESAELVLSWNRPATTRLLLNPLPAPVVRQFIPRPLGSIWAIPDELATLLNSHAKAGATKTAAPTSPQYGSAIATTISYTPPRKVTVHRRHDAILEPFEERLRTAQWSREPFPIGTKRVDLAMRRGSKLILVEAKTINTATNDAVRAAFAQLAEYSWLHRRAHGNGPSITSWALFEQQPKPEEVQFLEEHSVRVSWSAKALRRFQHGPITAEQAPKFGL